MKPMQKQSFGLTLVVAGLGLTACTGTHPAALTEAWPAPPQAEAESTAQRGPYLRATGGLSILPSTDFRSSDAGALQDASASFDPGYAYTFGGGYRLNDAWSVEAEIGYRTNSIDTLRAGGGTVPENGDFASLGFFANARWHLPTQSRLQPYVGLGFGVLEEIDADLGLGPNVDYSDSGLAAQALVGLDYQLSRRWSLQAEGRYLHAFGFDLAAETGAPITYDADYTPISFAIGLTFSF
jgi:OmpA-OmpF porin, OOP family